MIEWLVAEKLLSLFGDISEVLRSYMSSKQYALTVTFGNVSEKVGRSCYM